MRSSAVLSRRAVLAAVLGTAVGGAVTGCLREGGGTAGGPGAGASTSPAARRDAALLAAAAADERVLLAAYDETLRAHPSLAGRLGAPRAHHSTYLRLFAPTRPRPPAATEGPSASPAPTSPAPTSPASGSPGSSSPPSGSPAPDTAASRDRALVRLAGLEAERAGRRRAACAAASPALAPLFGTVSAAETAHADLLGRPAADADGPVPATTSPAPAPRAGTGALERMLDITNGAIYACGVAGGVLGGSGPAGTGGRALAQAAFIAQRRLRDELQAEIRGRGGDPPAARAAYELPLRPRDAASALRLLAAVEDRLAGAAYAALGELADPHGRQFAVRALAGAAVRAQRDRIATGEPVDTASAALPGTA